MNSVDIGVNKKLISYYDYLKKIALCSDGDHFITDDILKECNFNTKEYNKIFLKDLVITADDFDGNIFKNYKVKKFM